MSEVTKVTVNLPTKLVDKLRRTAERSGITMTEALRQSVELQAFLDEQEAQKKKILLETPDGKLERVLRTSSAA